MRAVVGASPYRANFGRFSVGVGASTTRKKERNIVFTREGKTLPYKRILNVNL